MLDIKKIIASVVLFAVAASVNANVITFDDNGEQDYFVDSVTSDGFIIFPAGDLSNLGTSNDFDTVGLSNNATVYLTTWSNSLPSTGFMMSSLDNALFSLFSFDFSNAYQDLFNSTSSITVTGMFADSTTTSQTFTDLEALLTFETFTFNDTFNDLVSVTFVASGDNNVRALYDNIVFDAVDVSVPASGLLFVLAFLGMASFRRK